MMLQPEMGHMVAQRVQEMIAAIVARTEQRAGFLHQVPILANHLRAHFQGPVAVGRQVQVVRDAVVGPQVDGAVVRSGRHRRIHHGGKRSRLEFDLVAGFFGDGQGGAIAPAVGDAQGGLVLQVVGLAPLGVEQQLVPAQDREFAGG